MKNNKAVIIMILVIIAVLSSQPKKESVIGQPSPDEVVRVYNCIEMGGRLNGICDLEFEYQEKVNGEECCLPSQ